MAAETLVPTTPAEAAEMFGDGDGITVLAGGTILMPEIAAGRLKPTRALLLHRSGLAGIDTGGDAVRIGAATPLAALVDAPVELLALFAARIGDEEVRRSATLGGNLCATPGLGSQRGDLGAPLIALGARVRSTGKGGERTEAVEDFLAGDRAGRLVLDVEVDASTGAWGAEMMRRRHSHSYAIANVAVCTSGDGLRVGVSAVSETATRCRTVEESRDPADVLKDVTPIDDALASAEYRAKILPLLVRRALEQLETR